MIARDRYERWLLSEIQSLLAAGFREIAVKLLTDFADLTGSQQARRARLFSQIARQLSVSYGQADTFLQAQMKSYAGIEARVTLAHMRGLVAESKTTAITLENLTRAEVKAIAEFPIAGLGIGEWFEKQASDMNAATRGQIQLGLLNGETPQQLARRIRFSAGADGLTVPVEQRSRHAALTLVRTTTTTVQTQASFETMRNIDERLVKRYRYVAVRDARTTPICRALDGKVYAFDDPQAKRPPQHPNCRSTIVAVVDYEFLGIPAPNTLKGGLSMGSYADWLKGRPAAEQNDILGSVGAKLFREQKTGLSDLVNSDGRKMTNKALAALYGVTA